MSKSIREMGNSRPAPSELQRLGKGAALATSAAAALVAGDASAATIAVNSTADNVTGSDTSCTLREAIANANSDSDTTGGDCVAGSGTDTIDLSSLSGTITLGGTHLLISDSANVTGPGASSLTIDSNNASRVFYIYSNSASLAVTISGMTMTHGQIGAGNGSVVGNRGESVTLDGVTINASVPRFGVIGNVAGAGGALSIQNSTISGNTGGTVRAGGVYVWGGNLTINNTTISGNGGNKGGGVFVRNISNPVSITNSTISGNTASDRGGGVGFYTVNSTVTISNSIISGNTASGRGGGLFFYKVNQPITISDTTISGNTSNIRGGGIFLYKSTAPGTFTIERSTISGNTTPSRGGGLFLYRTNSALKLENSTVSGNSALNGGGLYMRGSFGGSHSFNIQSSTIAFNTATANGGNISGGPSANLITITNSIVAGGSAASGPDMRNGSATFTLNYSLLQSTSGATIGGSNNLTGVDPLLTALANNGGPTQTHRFSATSPVVDAGSSTFITVPATDQRGLSRVVGANVDMGAVESQAPVVTSSGGATTWLESNSLLVTSIPVVIDSGITITDPVSTTLITGTVSITGGFQSSEDVLAFTNDGSTMGDIAGSYVSGTGVLTLTSSSHATLAQWQAALRAITFNNTAQPPTGATRTIGFLVNNGSEDSAVATKTINLTNVNHAPIFTLGSDPSWPAGTHGLKLLTTFASVTSFGQSSESGQAVVAYNVTDATDPGGVINGGSSGILIQNDGTLLYSLSGQSGTATITVTLQDDGGTSNGGSDTSPAQTFHITVADGWNLAIAMDDSTGGKHFFTGGDFVDYVITVQNLGTADAHGATVLDVLPSELSSGMWTCLHIGASTCTASGTGNINDTVNIPANGGLIYHLTAIAQADPETTITNTATVTTGVSEPDTTLSNNTATNVDTVGVYKDGFE